MARVIHKTRTSTGWGIDKIVDMDETKPVESGKKFKKKKDEGEIDGNN